MKWNMVRIEWMSFLLMFGAVYGSEKTETVSAAEKACRLRMAGNSNSAKEMLLEHLKNHPDDAVAQFEYSRTLFYLMDFETAEAHAGLAVQQDMDNPRYHYWQGLCETYLFIDKAHHKNELDLSILKRSINELQKTIELKPDYHQARYLLVNLLNNNPPDQGGNPQKAQQHMERLMEMDLDYGLQAMMVVQDKQSMDWKIKQYQTALAKEPDNAGLHAGIALLYAESDQIENLREHLDRALKLDKQQKDVLLKIAFRLAGKEKYPAAKEMVNRYQELAKDESAAMRAFALHYLAGIEQRSGNPEQSTQIAEQMKQIDPNVWKTMQPPPAILFEPLE